jgi:hypothetical protein
LARHHAFLAGVSDCPGYNDYDPFTDISPADLLVSTEGFNGPDFAIAIGKLGVSIPFCQTSSRPMEHPVGRFLLGSVDQKSHSLDFLGNGN